MRTLSLIQSFVAFRSSFHQIYTPVTSWRQIFYQKKYFLYNVTSDLFAGRIPKAFSM